MNLVFGILAIFMMLIGGVKYGPLIDGPICILLALIADGMDGRIARHLGTAGEFGKEMDSLCDVVSFGVAPGIMSLLFTLYVLSTSLMKLGIPPENLKYFIYFSMFAGIIYAVCGMFRLARFNVNAATLHGYFMGLPIPAGGCFIATATLLVYNLPFIPPITIGYAAPFVTIVIGFLMVSHVHYPDFKGQGEKNNLAAVVLSLFFAVGVIYVCRSAYLFAILFAVFSTYVVYGILNTFFNMVTKEKTTFRPAMNDDAETMVEEAEIKEEEQAEEKAEAEIANEDSAIEKGETVILEEIDIEKIDVNSDASAKEEKTEAENKKD